MADESSKPKSKSKAQQLKKRKSRTPSRSVSEDKRLSRTSQPGGRRSDVHIAVHNRSKGWGHHHMRKGTKGSVALGRFRTIRLKEVTALALALTVKHGHLHPYPLEDGGEDLKSMRVLGVEAEPKV